MTAFVRLSNKKHLQHASRHAELHFSDGLCIMAHSPKAFLLTFHLLVRKSHYQHKMNFLKLEAYPLLARIRQLLPVLGQCLMYFIAAVFLLVASNAALTGSLHGLLGKASHTALGAVPLAAFLCLYRNNHRDLALGFVLWLILSIPPITTAFLETKPLSTLDIAENNVWAMTQAVLLIAGTGLTGLIRHRAVRFSAAALMTCCWILAFLPIASFLVYLIGFDALLTPDIVLALAQTHPNEAWEYLTFMGPFMMGVVALACLTLLALSVAAFKKGMHSRSLPQTTAFRIAVLTTCCLAAISSFKSANNVSLYAFYNAYIHIRETGRFEEGYEQRKAILEELAKAGQKGRSGLFVFVIGESHTRDRMTAYGPQEHETTPWLKDMRSDRNFILFDKAYTSYVATVSALTYALTAKNQYNDISYDDSPSIVEVVRASGYETYWLSNQSKISPWSTPISIISSNADHHVWLGETYDGELLKHLPTQDGKPTVIFIHLVGSHTDYPNRYPPEYKFWDEQDRTNAYDNSLRYNDWVLSQLYEAFKARPDFQVMIYMADHGENPKLGHRPAHFTWDMARIPPVVCHVGRFREKAPSDRRRAQGKRSETVYERHDVRLALRRLRSQGMAVLQPQKRHFLFYIRPPCLGASHHVRRYSHRQRSKPLKSISTHKPCRQPPKAADMAFFPPRSFHTAAYRRHLRPFAYTRGKTNIPLQTVQSDTLTFFHRGFPIFQSF